MKRILTLMMCLQVFLAMGQLPGRLVRVVDGDTYDLEWNGKTHRCRLANVDAPELPQHWGLQSRIFAEQTLGFKVLSIDSLGKDFYGRSLIRMHVDGLAFDSLLIITGNAWYYEQFGMDGSLADLQQMAIAKKAGLWVCGAQAVCPPWLYRGYDFRNRWRYCKGCNTY